MFLNDFFERLLKVGRDMNMTEREFLEHEIQYWIQSPERQWQIDGYRYYRGQQDIESKQRTAIGAGGVQTVVDNVPNNKLIDNRYAFLVDQKANYLLSKPIDVVCDNESAKQNIDEIFNHRFCQTMKKIGKDALNGGKTYMFLYIGDDKKLHFKRFRSFEVLPFWADDDHTIMDAALRLYTQEVYEGNTKEFIKRVEWYTPEGVMRYTFKGGNLTPESEDFTPYFVINDAEGDPDNPQGYNWGKVPIVCFKANGEEIPLIKRVKSLQDALNQLYSMSMDNMQEDARNTILVLRNYDGQDLGQFRRNLSQYGAVKVREDGGVETLQIAVNIDNYSELIKIIKRAIIENGRGLDTKDDRLTSGSPNMMNIRSMYSDISLDADDMEMEFQSSLQDLMWFINKYNGLVSNPQSDVTFVFNRDTMMNETDTITNCRNSMGMISEETILANHPWVKNVQEEQKTLDKEKQKQMAAFDGYGGNDGDSQWAKNKIGNTGKDEPS